VEVLVREVVDRCDVEAEARGCRLVLVEGGPAVVRGEPELIRRAVENVVRNAIYHAPEGTSIEVGLEAHGGCATVTVRDRGAGVPPALLEAIFEPFFRVDGDRSRATGGAGLGLSIARRAVQLHGGRIAACDAGPGLAVTVELPLAHRSPRPDAVAAS
jgi:two-component system sensor histidine kinase CpxA